MRAKTNDKSSALEHGPCTWAERSSVFLKKKTIAKTYCSFKMHMQKRPVNAVNLFVIVFFYSWLN
jgi:hypothetical protein